jgi:L-fucose mutarotase
LAGSGHFAPVLIADGNVPVSGKRGPNARAAQLNLKPGTGDALNSAVG